MTVEIRHTTTEAKMISSFLLAEISSTRFTQLVMDSIVTHGRSKELVENPDLNDQEENIVRKNVLMDYRGHYFSGFPMDVEWNSGQLMTEEIARLKTINFDYWLNFSDNTRSLAVIANKIRSGIQYKSESNDIFYQIAEALGKSETEPVILVGENLDELVILEGHFRLLAHLLQDNQDRIIPTIIGFSKNISNWALY